MMPRLLCFGLIAAVCAAAETTTIEHRVEKKFTVPPGATLTLDTFTGAINVTETDGNMVEVTLREECGAKDEAAAAPKFANLEVSMEQKDRQESNEDKQLEARNEEGPSPDRKFGDSQPQADRPPS